MLNRRYGLSTIQRSHLIRLISALVISFIFLPAVKSLAQAERENAFVKWTTWAVLQAIPSPTLFEDRDGGKNGTEFGLEWQVIPFSYTFKPNKYLSHTNFFFIKPVKRFTGSAELFFNPQLITGTLDNAELKKFMFVTGGRIVIPLAQGGEYLSFSIGGGYYRQTDVSGKKIDGIMYEAAVYSFFGLLGLKFNYKQNGVSRYNAGLYFKYY